MIFVCAFVFFFVALLGGADWVLERAERWDQRRGFGRALRALERVVGGGDG